MTEMYAKKVGFSNTDTIHTFQRDTTSSVPTMNIKPKVTSGLNTTHGLKKLTEDNDLNTLLQQI